MTTPEQQARVRAYERLAQNQCHGTAIQGRANEPEQELANLIAERDALKAELAAIKGAGEPVAWGQLGTLNGKTYLREKWDRRPYPPPPSIIKCLNLVPLYTRPCVPLTDELIDECIEKSKTDFLLRRKGPSGQQLTAYDSWNHWFAREVEARIKGAKP